ncbi:hypothetical protein DVT68_01095 [Dyella solisilvae]|uniref:Uncharacterized protein n=1 Tax=Dyella solisilvae TaxID=1920168 RepID=A0A370KAL3_9GAMM|nr:hypothetical protein [Dyella solisilvae]RDI99487.1 hypothetical protein DVT68_01095 [Dyella solisilvae]
MSHDSEEFQAHLQDAFDDLLALYRLLEQENELLRAQLRRHAVGEMQIRETDRRMLDLRVTLPPSLQERLRTLHASRHA